MKNLPRNAVFSSATRIVPVVLFALAGVFAGGCSTARTTPAPVDPALRDPEQNSAIKPVPREGNWLKRHEGFVELARRGGINVLFLGDSITDFWRNADPTRGGKPVWDREYAPLGAANFGISGDRTQHVLWRLGHGEIDGINPNVVVLMIGTNNTGFESDGTTHRNTPAEIVEGVKAVVSTLRSRLPKTKILLLAIFPRGEKPDHPQRRQIVEINTAVAKFDDGRHVHFLDIGPKFLAADGTMPREIMPDLLHPGIKGYEIWATAIKEPLARLLE